jgi:hypothetical protein
MSQKTTSRKKQNIFQKGLDECNDSGASSFNATFNESLLARLPKCGVSFKPGNIALPNQILDKCLKSIKRTNFMPGQINQNYASAAPTDRSYGAGVSGPFCPAKIGLGKTKGDFQLGHCKTDQSSIATELSTLSSQILPPRTLVM